MSTKITITPYLYIIIQSHLAGGLLIINKCGNILNAQEGGCNGMKLRETIADGYRGWQKDNVKRRDEYLERLTLIAYTVGTIEKQLCRNFIELPPLEKCIYYHSLIESWENGHDVRSDESLVEYTRRWALKEQRGNTF